MGDPRHYAGLYRDALGAEDIVVINDGVELVMSLRGQQFSGADFDSLSSDEPVINPGRFTLTSDGDLCDYTLTIRLPLMNHVGSCDLTLHLKVDLEGDAQWAIGDAAEPLQWRSPYAMEQVLQAVVRPEHAPSICLRCAKSELEPSNGSLSNLVCMRAATPPELVEINRARSYKERYGRAWSVLGRRCRYVQQIWSCSEFEPE